MLLTVPAGKDAVFLPLERVYGEERLPRLLDGFECSAEQYWTKASENLWHEVDRKEALAFEARVGLYALGLFVLRVGR